MAAIAYGGSDALLVHGWREEKLCLKEIPNPGGMPSGHVHGMKNRFEIGWPVKGSSNFSLR